MINKKNIKSNIEINDWLKRGGLTNEEYNFKVIDRLKLLNKPENYGNPCWNCGANHTIYDNLRVTERDIRNLDFLINEGGSTTMNDIKVSNDTGYHDKRGFYCLVYYNLAKREDQMQDDGNFKQTYTVTDTGRQFAAGLISIPAYYAQRDNIIVDRSNTKTITRDEVFENKFRMQDVLDCNKRINTLYIPFDQRKEGDNNRIIYSTDYAVKYGKQLVLKKLKEQGHITEHEILVIMETNFGKTNTRDIIYGLLSDGIYLGYLKRTKTFWLLKRRVWNSKLNIWHYIDYGGDINAEMANNHIKRKSVNMIEIEPLSRETCQFKNIYLGERFKVYNDSSYFASY